MLLETLLRTFEQKLKDYNPICSHFLNAGLGQETIQESLAGIDLPFTEDFYALYSWKDGSNWNGEERDRFIPYVSTNLFVLASFIPLKTAVRLYNARAGKDEFWQRSMFPLFQDNGGGFYLLNVDLKDEKIYYNRVDDESEDWCQPIFTSLSACFATIDEWYASKAIVYDPVEGYARYSDDKKAIEIARRRNPDCRYWA